MWFTEGSAVVTLTVGTTTATDVVCTRPERVAGATFWAETCVVAVTTATNLEEVGSEVVTTVVEGVVVVAVVMAATWDEVVKISWESLADAGADMMSMSTAVEEEASRTDAAAESEARRAW